MCDAAPALKPISRWQWDHLTPYEQTQLRRNPYYTWPLPPVADTLTRHVAPWIVEREAALLQVIADAVDAETGATSADDVRTLLQGGLGGFFARVGQILPHTGVGSRG